MYYQHHRPILWTTMNRKLSSSKIKVHQRLPLKALASKLVTHETGPCVGDIAQIHSRTSEIHASLNLKQSYLPLNILYADWPLHLWIIASIHARMYNWIHAGRKSSLVLLDRFGSVRLQIYLRNFMAHAVNNASGACESVSVVVYVRRGFTRAATLKKICCPPFVSSFLNSDQYVDWSPAAGWAPALALPPAINSRRLRLTSTHEVLDESLASIRCSQSWKWRSSFQITARRFYCVTKTDHMVFSMMDLMQCAEFLLTEAAEMS